MTFKTWNIKKQKAIIPEKLKAKEVNFLNALLTVLRVLQQWHREGNSRGREQTA